MELTISAELKEAARRLIAEWSLLDTDELGQCGIRHVAATCRNAEEARTFKEEALALNSRLQTVNGTCVLIDNQVTVSVDLFLPSQFADAIQDISDTGLHSLEVSSEMLAQMDAYRNAFRIPFVKLSVAHDGGSPDVVAICRDTLLRSHTLLMDFLNELDRSRGLERPYLVHIHNDCSFTIDGVLSPKAGNLARTFFALYLLGVDKEFAVEDFGALYAGDQRGKDTAKKCFDNERRKLLQIFPKLKVIADRKTRKVSGLVITTACTDEQIQHALEMRQPLKPDRQ